MRKNGFALIVCLFIGLAVSAGCSFGTRKFRPEELMVLSMKDLDLEEVSLGKLIKANEVTMLNVWQTSCGPCIKEMPALNRLSEKYADRGFGIIGITYDIVGFNGEISESLLNEARNIAAASGISYPLLIASPETKELLRTSVVPVSWFVNAEGRVLKGPVPGSNSESGWESVISGLTGK